MGVASVEANSLTLMLASIVVKCETFSAF